MWSNNTKDVDISVSEIFDNIDRNVLLQAFTIKEIKDYLYNLALKNGVDEKGDPKLDENAHNEALNESFEIEVDIDTDDLDISEYSDDEIIDEYNSRKLYRIDKRYCDEDEISTFLGERYDINVSAYTDEELIDFVFNKLKKKY